MVLALPSFDIIDSLYGHKIVDCGAGDGLWAYILEKSNLDVVAIDPDPRGFNVQKGTHEDLYKFSDRLLLIVWPPDATDLNDWIKVWKGKEIAICGDPDRFIMPEINISDEFHILGGDKDYSRFIRGTIDA